MKRKIFYGWYIVLAGMAVMGTAIGIVNNCFGLLVVPVCEELGFTREAMGYNQMINSAGATLIALVAGPLFARFNLRRLMCLSGVAICAGYFLYSVARTLPAFYAISTVVAVAQGLITVLPFSVIIHNWFHERVGTAMGLTFMGTGLGGMLFNMLGGQLIAQLGWRPTVRVFAAIMAGVLLPCLFLVIRTRPEDKGLAPLGSRPDAEAAQIEAYGLCLKQAVRTSRFYLLVLGLFVSGLAVNAIASSYTPHLTDVLGSPTTAATIASGFMLGLACGKFALGWLFDRLGARLATLLSLALLGVALFSLSMAETPVFIGAFLASAGLACAFGSVPFGLLSEKAFGTRDYGAITGIFNAVSSFGAMLAPPLCGRVRDLSGSYAPAYQWLGVCVLAVIVPMLLGIPRAAGRKTAAQG